MTTSASASTAGRSASGAARPAYSRGQPLGALAGAVDDDDLGGAAARDGGGGQPGHRAGADHGDPATGDVAAVAGGAVERGADERGAALSMSVSARERLPTRSACWKSTLSAGPTVPSSWPSRSASRVWPRIWPSPTAIESSPAATWNRCETAPSS